MLCNIIISIFSLIIGLIIALLYFLFPFLFINLVIPLILVIIIALLSLGGIVYTLLKIKDNHYYGGLWNSHPICQCGPLLVFSSIVTIATSLIALTIPWIAIINFNFILMFLLSTSLASMLISLYYIIRSMIRESCFRCR